MRSSLVLALTFAFIEVAARADADISKERIGFLDYLEESLLSLVGQHHIYRDVIPRTKVEGLGWDGDPSNRRYRYRATVNNIYDRPITCRFGFDTKVTYEASNQEAFKRAYPNGDFKPVVAELDYSGRRAAEIRAANPEIAITAANGFQQYRRDVFEEGNNPGARMRNGFAFEFSLLPHETTVLETVRIFEHRTYDFEKVKEVEVLPNTFGFHCIYLDSEKYGATSEVLKKNTGKAHTTGTRTDDVNAGSAAVIGQ